MEESFMEWVQEGLTRSGFKQAALARRVGVDQSYISRLKRLPDSRPNRELVIRLGDAFAQKIPLQGADRLEFINRGLFSLQYVALQPEEAKEVVAPNLSSDLAPTLLSLHLPPESTVIRIREDVKPYLKEGEFAVLVPPSAVAETDRLRKVALVRLHGKEELLRYEGIFVKDCINVYQFRRGQEAFTVPLQDAEIKGFVLQKLVEIV